ncbi:MAG: sulfatase-like hydrolase/transferase [Spirochaetales bacterium]|jgi:arylsulfatase|nr:sulfatase-like hydrolase/transferase [Spirochaetales bacterium]
MKHPNILLICVDHWPGQLLHAAGHKTILSPTLDQLCANGTRFTEAYSSAPTCIPARRALMTGTTAKTHGDRVFNQTLRMDPSLPTLAGVLGDAGYQTEAVGKLHVYPQRSRIGFDEVILNEEGRNHLGLTRDDYQLFLLDEGYAGQELTHGMGNNNYSVRPWHLPEHLHQTHWTTKQMCRTIHRRDPDRPSFWYCSYAAPHPPITPPGEYLDMYKSINIDMPYHGEWAETFSDMPYALKARNNSWSCMDDPEYIRAARMGFYAQCTYIDHQLRLLVGTLREEGLLDDTIIMFTCDHGDMLGNHGLWAKPPMFENSAKIPMILVPNASAENPVHHTVDNRFAELRDVMPTLLDLCGVDVPETVEGISLVSDERRDSLYCEHYDDEMSMRMVRKDTYKLIYYATGNRFQLFDLDNDPHELQDLSQSTAHQKVKQELTDILIGELYGSDLEWIQDGELKGLPDLEYIPSPDYGLCGQRGWRF